MRNALNVPSGVVMFGILLSAGFLAGCDNLARSQGKFPIASSFGSEVLSDESVPLNPKLFVPLRDKQGNTVPLLDKNGKPVPLTDTSGNAIEMIPLIRVAYRSPWDGKVVNSKNAQSWDKQSYYMVVDVTNLARDPSLRSIEDPVQRRAAIRAIADALVVAADWNGDVYWRHLTTFLEAYKAGNSAAQTLYGGAIAGSFISPVLGASLAGSALVIDTAVRDYTANLDVDDYAKLRTAASSKRKVLKETIFQEIDEMQVGKESTHRVFSLAYDYAFTYSIKGALSAVAETNEKMQEYLLTGKSSWTLPFADSIDRLDEEYLRRGVYVGEEKTRVEARLAKNRQAKIDRETADQAAEKEATATALANAKKARADAERAAAEAETKKLEAERNRDNLRHEVNSKTPNPPAATQTQEETPPFDTPKPAK